MMLPRMPRLRPAWMGVWRTLKLPMPGSERSSALLTLGRRRTRRAFWRRRKSFQSRCGRPLRRAVRNFAAWPQASNAFPRSGNRYGARASRTNGASSVACSGCGTFPWHRMQGCGLTRNNFPWAAWPRSHSASTLAASLVATVNAPSHYACRQPPWASRTAWSCSLRTWTLWSATRAAVQPKHEAAMAVSLFGWRRVSATSSCTPVAATRRT
mmetsp:Transcript_99834/g.213774  ORF Transcript_99834/g.213774 Transcript_99834/m.213774 type:complete len:212 (-) Transcript_99834:206-841(-)